MIPGTEGASASVFSPDGKWVAFVQRRRKVMKVPLDGGAPIPLADIADNGGIDWSPSGDLVIGAGVMEGGNGLYRVNPAGGPLVPLTRVDRARKELSHQWPRFLADGKTLLLTIWYGAIDRSEIAVTSINDGKVIPLGILGAKPLGVAGGRLVYVRNDGMAMAVPFDVAKRSVSGVPQPVQDSIRMWDGSGGDASAFLTHDGGLVYARGTLNRRLVWVDRNGNAQPALPERREYRNMRLSPNGQRVALTIAGAARSDIWIFDLASGTVTPLTTTGNVRNPAWSPDGRRILYVSTQGGRSGFWWHPSDGSGPPVSAAVARNNPWNIDISADGRTAAFNAVYDGTFNIRSIALDSAHEERELAASPTAIETYARFSPDGRHLAYQSDESGQFEVYVRPYPESGSRVQISNAGGRRPIWAPDGKTIYFWEGSHLTSAMLAFDPVLRVAARSVLFDGRYEVDFDISRDGTRFLMIESESSGLGLVAVPNWLTELKQSSATRNP
jgi:serine/threonine-protein kinase